MSRRLQRGVSLIEALVAFAIMAFGMMAVVGMQGTMRGNADIARQRAEAVRLAQDSLEEWRGFSTVTPPPAALPANRMDYTSVDGNSTRTVTGTNASYTVTRRALARPVVAGTVSPDGRGVVVDVTWVDRTNLPQLVRLSSTVAGLSPELSASLVLSTATDPAVAPLNRHRAIPPGAVGGVPVSVCTNCSGYVPPGQTGGGDRVAWMFNNRTAEITLCTTDATSTAQLASVSTTITCGSNKALLLSGFVRQLPDGLPATNAAADPQGPNRPFTLQVERLIPTPVTSFDCFQDAPLSPSNAVPYFCAIPVTSGSPAWSGNVIFGLPTGSPFNLANVLSDDDTDELKVCRYFGTSAVRSPTFAAIGQPLTSQNFLIIQAGNGSTPYSCPTGTPATYAHQPDA